jgi:hypothetical protein
MNLEIIERSSGYWIVGEHGVEWYEPFVHLSQAINQLNKMLDEKKLLFAKINTENKDFSPFK